MDRLGRHGPPLGAAALFAIVAGSCLGAQDGAAPKVVRRTPAHGAIDVDPATTTELVVVFDRDMSQGGYSFCGGGPSFPPIPPGERAFWRDARTCVLPVRLAYDRSYRLSINCPAADGFRSAAGVPAEASPWRFTTRSSQSLDPRERRALNEASRTALLDVLRSRYSYYDRLDLDWKRLARQHRAALTKAESVAAWAAAAAEMLAAAEDIHVYLRIDDPGGGEPRVFATARRAVDPLFRRDVLDDHVETRALADAVSLGLVRDDAVGDRRRGAKPRIGYLRIDAWQPGEVDLDALDEALADTVGTVDAMIVDVRTNAGGDERIAQHVAAWFLGDAPAVYAKNRYRTGPGRGGFGPVLDRTLAPRDGERLDDIPIAVLTSRYVMSSNEGFVLMMRRAPDCTVVGETTYGASGNPKPHTLPNGVTVVLPSWQALRPDGTCFEGEGLEPDVEVGHDEAVRGLRNGDDPILETAIEHLCKTLGSDRRQRR